MLEEQAVPGVPRPGGPVDAAHEIRHGGASPPSLGPGEELEQALRPRFRFRIREQAMDRFLSPASVAELDSPFQSSEGRLHPDGRMHRGGTIQVPPPAVGVVALEKQPTALEVPLTPDGRVGGPRQGLVEQIHGHGRPAESGFQNPLKHLRGQPLVRSLGQGRAVPQRGLRGLQVAVPQVCPPQQEGRLVRPAASGVAPESGSGLPDHVGVPFLSQAVPPLPAQALGFLEELFRVVDRVEVRAGRPQHEHPREGHAGPGHGCPHHLEPSPFPGG